MMGKGEEEEEDEEEEKDDGNEVAILRERFLRTLGDCVTTMERRCGGGGGNDHPHHSSSTLLPFSSLIEGVEGFMESHEDVPEIHNHPSSSSSSSSLHHHLPKGFPSLREWAALCLYVGAVDLTQREVIGFLLPHLLLQGLCECIFGQVITSSSSCQTPPYPQG